jgi:serine protease Do
MSSIDPDQIHFESSEPPPRPSIPIVRRGFLVILGVLSLLAALVYGIPYFAFRAGFAFEAGRSKAAEASLARLDEAGVIGRASALFRAAATAVAPAVVNIQCMREVRMRPGPEMPEGFAGQMPSSFGSGVIIDKARGYVVTNGHVVEGADEITVRLGAGREYPARLLGADGKTDIAVLQINAPLEAEASWGDVDSLEIGDWVLAIGSPFTLERSVTLGIVSAIGRRNLRIIGDGIGFGYEDFIQTDAAINPGNSGGPLVDLRGKVIGINTAIFSPRLGPQQEGPGGNVGIGFAISSALAQSVVDQLIKNGRVVRGYMGVILKDLSQADAERLGAPSTRGALIVDVDPESPAELGGLRPDDVVIELAGKPVSDTAELRNRTAGLPVGSTVPLRFLRDGKTTDSSLTISEFPSLRAMGLRLRTGRPDELNGDPGVVVEGVQPGSPAHLAGFRRGWKILAVGNRRVDSRQEAEAIAGRFDNGSGVPIQVLRNDGQRMEVILGGRSRPR